MNLQKMRKITKLTARSIRMIGDRRERIHFLHIGKNAGTQIKFVGNQINSKSKSIRFVYHSHQTHLPDIPNEQKYFFSIRNPITRFKSGFYSRKRKGQPRIYSEWKEHERLAFEAFEHANDLAEALFQKTPKGSAAFSAIRSISHTASQQNFWFDNFGFFLETIPPVHIIRQENFDHDLGVLMSKLGLSIPVDIASDSVTAHRNNYSDVPELSQAATENLYRWYSADFEFYRLCEDWINANNS